MEIKYRDFLKSNFGEWDDVKSDQQKGIAPPPLQKTYENTPILLTKNFNYDGSFTETLSKRRSRRKYQDEAISLNELSYLLWMTQGVQKKIKDIASLRPVPSGGARHPLETYLWINEVEGLASGLYYYLPLDHALVLVFEDPVGAEKINDATFGQRFVGGSPLVFIWSAIPYKGEWRYHISAHKMILMDAGHLCQNLYLSAEVLGLGACAIGAYDQVLMDQFMGFDGEDEFVIYMSPIGRV